MSAKFLSVLLIFLSFQTTQNSLHFFSLNFGSCRHPSTCIEIFKCSKVVQNFSLKSILVLKVKTSYCGFEGFTLKVCCSDIQETTEPSTRVERWSNELVNHKNFDLLPMDICGVISTRFRITSGVSTSPGEFPWMALIAYRTGDLLEDQDFKCGGTLINEIYVLTAAHCIDNSTILGVRLGEYNIMTEIDCDSNGQNCEAPTQDLLINKTITHPSYDPSSYVNDIALIRLAQPANYDSNVRPICLPYGDLLHVSLDGQELTVAGWGATEQGGKSTILRKVSVPVVPTADCKRLYENFKPISARQICAGAGKGRDSCAGDSGGPLKRIDSINQSPRYVQYGIVSFGPIRCGINGRPGIYTNVKEYMEWILDSMEPYD